MNLEKSNSNNKKNEKQETKSNLEKKQSQEIKNEMSTI